MNIKTLILAAVGGVVGLSGLAASPALAEGEQFIPMLVYRTGPYAPSGIPAANGFRAG